MYICICICIYMCVQHLCVFIYVCVYMYQYIIYPVECLSFIYDEWKRNQPVTRLLKFIVCIDIHVCIYSGLCIFTCVCIFMCVHIYVCIYLCVYIFMCIYIYMCIYIHKYIIYWVEYSFSNNVHRRIQLVWGGYGQSDWLNYRSLLQNIVSFVWLFCKRDL